MPLILGQIQQLATHPLERLINDKSINYEKGFMSDGRMTD